MNFREGIFECDNITANIFIDISENRYETVTEDIVFGYMREFGYKSRYAPDLLDYVEAMNSIVQYIPKNCVVSDYSLIYKCDNKFYTILTPINENQYKDYMYEIRDNIFRLGVRSITIILPYDGNTLTKSFSEFDNISHGKCLIIKHKILDELAYFTCKEKPVQIVLNDYILFMKEYEINKIHKVVDSFDMKVYVHSPINQNISNPEKCDSDKMGKYLSFSNKCGFHGVVFHVGSSVKQKIEHAKDYMLSFILRCLPHASRNCPFLLETPSGKGSETLSDLEEFKEFVRKVKRETPEEYKDNFGICVDTCHVYAAGYLPTDYINSLLYDENHETGDLASSLKLIHFNDSCNFMGAKKDNHAKIGKGTIGVGQFLKILNINILHNIPLIYEESESEKNRAFVHV